MALERWRMQPAGLGRMLLRSAEACVIDNDFDGARAAADALLDLAAELMLTSHPDSEFVTGLALELSDLAGFPWEE